MTAWQIYWVMQLDSINSFFLCSTAGAVFAPMAAGMISDGELVWNYEQKRIRRWAKVCFWMAPLFLIAAVLTPSTKTAAAMIVLPAIANSETLRKEAGELYGLAKEALRDAIDAPEPKEQSK